MRIASLLCGAKGVRTHKHIRKGMEAIERILNIVYEFSFMTSARFNCLANFVVLFSTWVFPSGNPTLILGGI